MGKSRQFSIEPGQALPDPRSQHDKFVEIARELGADGDDSTLDRVLGKVAPPVLPKKPNADLDRNKEYEPLVRK